jgi:DNA-binding beta-propeller fold protein YncE
MRKGQMPFRMGRRLPLSDLNNEPGQSVRSRTLRIAAAALPLAGVFAFAGPASPAKAAPNTVTAPTYVRTIGTNGESTMYPSGVAVDAAGNVYVADTGNYQIEKYAAGTTTLDWSVGVRGAPIGGGTDSFTAPRDLATDGSFVYVADTDDATVQVLNANTGAFVQNVKTFGSGGTSTFQDPIGISVGHNGSTEEILVSDGVTGNVYVFGFGTASSPIGSLLFFVPPTNATEGTRDAATDSAGNIFTADYRGNAIDEYGPTDSTGATPIRSWGATSGCLDVAKPYGIDVDTADTPNRVYVASSTLSEIKVFDDSGNCLNVGTTGANIIGTPTSVSTDPTELFQLRRVAVGSGSSPLIYAADLWGLQILTYSSSTGAISSAQPRLGSGTYPAAGGLNEDHGIAIDPSTDQIFVANTVNQRIERFNLPNGDSPIDWGTKGVVESSASFNWAQGIAYDPADGNVWVANTRNNRIDEFSTDGTSIASCPNTSRLTSSFDWPMAVAFDPSGTMYVADTFNNRIEAVNVAQCTGQTVPVLWDEGTRGSGTNQFIKPWDLVYDPTMNRLLVADTNNSRIVELNPSTGAWEGVLPITKGTGPGQIESPEGIAVDASGNIWIADTGNNRVEEFTSAGAFANQMIGSYGCCYGAPNNEFNAPQGLAFDPNGQLYVADTNNNRIQVYQPAETHPFGPPGNYTAVTPFRICDTRPPGGGIVANQCDSGGGTIGPLTQNAPRAVLVGGHVGVPTSGVSAVVVNVTAIDPNVNTVLTLYPSLGSKPGTSNLNPSADTVVANLVEVAVGSDGKIDIVNGAGTVNVAIDIEGYVSTPVSGTAGLYNPTAPTRICDTRASGHGITSNQCDSSGQRLITPSTPLTFNVSGSGSPVPPSGVSAVVFNLTAITPTADTVLTAYPGGGTRPTASNVNLVAGAVVPNRVIVPVPAGCTAPNCTVTIWNGAGSVNVAVDIDGWYTDNSGIQTTGSLFSGVEPNRVCDTRYGNADDFGCRKAEIGAGGTLEIRIAGVGGVPVMGGAAQPLAVVINVTAVVPSAPTYVTVFSSDLAGPPSASDLNVPQGHTVTNLVVVAVGADGDIDLFNAAGNVNLIVDVLGYYSLS